MPRKAKKERFVAQNYTWLLGRRGGIWTADGRSNSINLGRHSLGTRDREEAERQLARLDLIMAVEHGKADRSALAASDVEPLPLEKGQDLYLAHAGRPRIAKGVKPSSLRRYKAPLRKFVAFGKQCGLTSWNQVRSGTFEDYAADLEERGFAYKTLEFELTTLLQAIKWLALAGHLPKGFKVEFSMQKHTGCNAYCWTREEVVAMWNYCRERPELVWLGIALWTLALTGMRISEMTALRWSNLNFQSGMVTLVDETTQAAAKRKGRQAQSIKNGQGRTFPIHPELRPVLESLPRHADGFVFRGANGKPIEDRLVRIGLKQVQAALAEQFPTPEEERGFADGTPHSFRHYFCSTCANGSLPERMVMKWLGHKNSEMVRHYYHVHDEEARRQMGRLSFGETVPA